MSFVAVAVGGSALIGAGAGIAGGVMQGNAAKNAANAQSDAALRGIATVQAGQRDALAYLDPYRQFGLNAGNALNNILFSPEQQQSNMNSQRAQLEGEVKRLTAAIPNWNTYQTFSGKDASERREAAFRGEYGTAVQKVNEAQAKLDAFNKQATVQAQGQAQNGPSGPTQFQALTNPQNLEASPWYQFQSQLLGRNMDRYFAARGLTGSGFEAESNRQGLLALGAQEVQSQFDRTRAAYNDQFNQLSGVYNTGANAAAAGAGSITGTSQGAANMQANVGNAQAQGIIGGTAGNVNALNAGVNAVNSGVGTYLNYNMFNNLMNRNKPSQEPLGVVNDDY